MLTDTRFSGLPANQRANVFSCILQPMKVEERNSILVQYMCILDWWLAVLNFISKDSENPRHSHPVRGGPGGQEGDHQERGAD